ncbi:hypothetical protein [Vibrio scophthalmi]|uniref:Guanylate cyclase domain-containing protein n=1 Tax=Vibrio scophthalmi TaxID=45658 RepID=A0A1E3WGC4_9VIBR|nr:hypothetical protein [Vibrio scophthalmi]ODS04562.1 hypothetical protein VSF3289_03701 [Vibrio scophthalmi]
MPTIDRDAVANIQYEKSFVAFLDVLGFKQMIKAANRDKINKYFGIVDSAISYLKGIESKQNISSIVISDSIILNVQCSDDNEENIEKLRQLCIAIGLIQQNLAIKGIWLRGAICHGDTYFDSRKSQVVGPAFVEAYLLEEKMAVNPRVILDSKIINVLNLDSAGELIDKINKKDEGGFNVSNWGSRILFDWTRPTSDLSLSLTQDVPLFIDYLCPIFEQPNNNDINRVLSHIKRAMYQNTQVYSKYRWVVDYIKVINSQDIAHSDITITPNAKMLLHSL